MSGLFPNFNYYINVCRGPMYKFIEESVFCLEYLLNILR